MRQKFEAGVRTACKQSAIRFGVALSPFCHWNCFLTEANWRAKEGMIAISDFVFVAERTDIQDRDGGILQLATFLSLYPFVYKIFGDPGYQGRVFENGVANIMAQAQVGIVKRSDGMKRFVVLPRRWVVERTLAWLNRCRRLAKDWENRTRNALAFL